MSLSGGEPTLRSDLLSIIDAARCEGLHPCLVSNGRAIDETLLRELDAREVNLSISVPGIETFERQTGYNGVEHVMGLFRAARQMGMRVTANIAVTKINLPELYETIAYSEGEAWKTAGFCWISPRSMRCYALRRKCWGKLARAGT